jgi:prephenate dehydrogenase
MGGSLAWTLKDRQACQQVTGVARRLETVKLAVEWGVVDHATTDLDSAIREADIVVLATPVRTIIEMLPRVGRLAKPGCMVLDLGSTKTQIIHAMEKLPERVQPVGGHPMCGKESSGLEVAETDLYQNRVFVLTPLERTSAEALNLAQDLVRALGSRPLLLDAQRHDRLAAASSHLPYLLSCGLMAAAEELAQEDSVLWELTASGFRDTSRLSASDVDVMLDILITNREAVLEAVGTYSTQLQHLIALLEAHDERALARALGTARDRRRRLFS